MSIIRYLFLSTFCSVFILYCNIAIAQKEITIPGSSDTDISVEIFEPRNKQQGKYLIVWLAPEYGFQTNHLNMANLLATQNIEVWQSDIAESLFLPQSSTSLKQLKGNYVADIIEHAHKVTGKKIIVAGDSYAAVNALTGAHAWQSRYLGSPYLIGAMLFSPNSYAYIPPLGLDPEFMPVMDSTNIPLIIYQAKNNGNIGQFKTVLEKLQQHDNPVYTKILPDVISLFHNKTPTISTQKTSLTIASNIKKMLPILAAYSVPITPVPLFKNINPRKGIDIYLKSFTGNNKPLNIKLIDAYDNLFIRNDFTKRVTVINFWATWCPPCVEEIPSLNRLNMAMNGLPFDLISINYAEDKQTILEFLKKVNVDFPVLLDPDGNYAKQWNVITYPSTFIIDTNGKIVYGVNAAIAWDDPKIIKIIKSLF
jgi:thiol-disulfide isomerase/thioredoxin